MFGAGASRVSPFDGLCPAGTCTHGPGAHYGAGCGITTYQLQSVHAVRCACDWHPRIAWTLGHAASYDWTLRTRGLIHTPTHKIGLREYESPAYLGGCVFKTKRDALMFAQRTPAYAVYRLLLPMAWDACVSRIPIEGTYRVQADALILGRDR